MKKGNFYLNKISYLLDGKGHALDLGCHTGQDSLRLAEMGYMVDAVDIKPFSKTTEFNFIQSDIVDFKIEKEKYSLIWASRVLPFVPDKKEVEKIISNMVNGLKKGGVMYFSLFGHKHEWADDPKMSFFDKEEVLVALKKLPVKIYNQSEEEGYGQTMDGSIRYRHIYNFYCVKK